MNNTGGLFGGLLIGVALLAGAVYISPSARAWLAGAIAGGSSTTAASGATLPTPAPNTGTGPIGGGWGSLNSATQADASAPYQLTLGGNGVQISTAATIPANVMPAIPLPSIAPLAPTSPTVSFA